MKLPQYPIDEAEQLAQHFFIHHYHDRGMLKWQGFFLSDHTSALQRNQAKQPERLRAAQPPAELSQYLERAWQQQISVHIQLNILDENQRPLAVDGQVMGVNADRVVIKKVDRHYCQLPLNILRSVVSSN